MRPDIDTEKTRICFRSPGKSKRLFSAACPPLVVLALLAGAIVLWGGVSWNVVLAAGAGAAESTGGEPEKSLSEARPEPETVEEPAQERKILYYVSPMDPTFKSDKPGKAPCGMDLVPVYEDEAPPAGAAGSVEQSAPSPAPSPKSTAEASASSGSPEEKPSGKRKILYYVDPMNPTQKSDKPGKAPCGMDLVPVYEDEGQSTAALPPGTIRISPQKQQLIGVRTGEVMERALAKTVRTVGRVAVDETKVIHVHTRFPGWIKKVYVDFTGKMVEKGQPLLSISSPDYTTAQQEYLIAKRSADALKKSPFEGVSARAASLVDSARNKLRLKDITTEQIGELEARNAPEELLTLHSSISGIVLSRHAFPGQYASPDGPLYAIADASSIWVLADIYEYELPMVKQGQPVTVTLPYFPGKAFDGSIAYVYPKLDPNTRTVPIRIEFANPDLAMKPEMFANVDIKVDYGVRLSVHREAVLDSGKVKIVFVARDGGYFEPRKVKLGQPVNDLYPVLEGLAAGERVVTSAGFLIDSESQIKSAVDIMSETEAGTGGAT